ncbi:MAG: hypothetical protein HUU41_11865 [Bryobacteraceae bacterium]|nr:hypothetical protein [Bryobacterales bacterium]NUN01802.1 hypothetical protein [Bryobacteraceae bacterium]
MFVRRQIKGRPFSGSHRGEPSPSSPTIRMRIIYRIDPEMASAIQAKGIELVVVWPGRRRGVYHSRSDCNTSLTF